MLNVGRMARRDGRQEGLGHKLFYVAVHFIIGVRVLQTEFLYLPPECLRPVEETASNLDARKYKVSHSNGTMHQHQECPSISSALPCNHIFLHPDIKNKHEGTSFCVLATLNEIIYCEQLCKWSATELKRCVSVPDFCLR
jgi:hypothetical protein